MEKITVNGVPLKQALNAAESKEIQRVALEEARQHSPAIRSNKPSRVRMGSVYAMEEKPVPGKVYSKEDQLGYVLVVKEKLMDGVDFSRQPTGTKKKLTRLFSLLKWLPENFISNEVIPDIRKEIGIADAQRALFQLVQGGLLHRELDRHGRMVYTKTATAKGGDGPIAKQLVAMNEFMTGYENPRVKNAKRRVVNVRSAHAIEEAPPVTAAPRDSHRITNGHERDRATTGNGEMEQRSAEAGKRNADAGKRNADADEFDHMREAYRAFKGLFQDMTVERFLGWYTEERKKMI